MYIALVLSIGKAILMVMMTEDDKIGDDEYDCCVNMEDGETWDNKYESSSI